MENFFTDLDELMLLCRDEQARILIREAVACYRSGAFRSCIISTWNAVVFDYIHKLRELKIFNDNQAIDELEHFETLNNNCDYKGLWQFEKNIPSNAKDKYEFISPIEQVDLERLFDDRSRCAHPSVKSLEEPFTPTAELARYHLRTSIIHFLQHPPVQGRKALVKVKQIIQSLHFPTELDEAIKIIQYSPLARPRFGLVKDIVLDLTFNLLNQDIELESQKRLFSALNAIHALHKVNVEKILNSNLSRIIINNISDDTLYKVITYLANISGWTELSYPCQVRLNSFIKNINFENLRDESINVLVEASHIDFLVTNVIKNFKSNLKKLEDILTICRMYENRIFNEKVASILIADFLPLGTVNQLIEIKLYSNDNLIFSIDEAITLKLKELDILELVKIFVRKLKKLPIDIYLSILKEKINQIDIVDLDELINAKEYYEFHEFHEDSQEIPELFNNQIQKILDSIDFHDLNKYCSSWNKISNDLLKAFLKKNTSHIICEFAKSSSFAQAYNISDFLVKITEFLTPEEWISIFDAFITNGQIFSSYGCVSNFSIMFKKCIELNIVEKTNWIKLKTHLDTWESCRERLQELKDLLNSYYSAYS